MDSLSSDSACYSAKENEGITRGLLELAERRKQDAIYAIRIGYCDALTGALRQELAQPKGFILGRYKRLQKRILKRLNQTEGKP